MSDREKVMDILDEYIAASFLKHVDSIGEDDDEYWRIVSNTLQEIKNVIVERLACDEDSKE